MIFKASSSSKLRSFEASFPRKGHPVPRISGAAAHEI